MVQAEKMREAKRLKKLESEESQEAVSLLPKASQTTPEAPQASQAAPASLGDEDTGDLEGDPDGDNEEDQEVTDPQEVFDDWMLTLTRDQRKMLAVLLHESFRKRQNMNKMNAAQEAASITGVFIISSVNTLFNDDSRFW